MYLPSQFNSTDLHHAVRLIADHPLALLVGPDAAGDSFGSHLPLVVVPAAEALVLEGHMARANPHWGWLSHQQRLLAVFSVGVRQSHLERGVAHDKDAVHVTIGGRDDKRQEDEAAVQRGAEGAGAG